LKLRVRLEGCISDGNTVRNIVMKVGPPTFTFLVTYMNWTAQRFYCQVN
jgi:hypothetical protein